MLGFVSSKEHKRILAEKNSEINGLMWRMGRMQRKLFELDREVQHLQARLAPFTTPRARDSRGRFIKDTVA